MPVRRPASPTLIALAMLASAALPSTALGATAEQRDEHFQAVTSILDKDFQLTGKRQRAAFAQASYPEDAWHRKALDWYAALREKGSTKDPKKVAELDKTATALRTELDAAEEAGKLPEAVVRLLSAAGSQTTQLMRDFATFMSPDDSAPTVARAPERIAIAQGQIVALIDAANKEWKKAKAKVDAAAAQTKLAMEGDEKDPKVQEATRISTMVRFEAVRSIYNAHTTLREVATRGADFGLDPKPANDFLKAFLKENFALIGDWEYNFGDYFPYLKAYANSVLVEAVRQKIPNAKIEDLESGLQTVAALDLKGFKAPADREDIIQLQIKCWTTLLRTRLELALAEPDKAKATAHLDKGLEFFANYKDAYRGQKDMAPGTTNVSRAWYIGQLWITAGRLQQAKGNAGGATGLFGEVAANKATFASTIAQGWLAKGSGAGAAGGEWGKPATPMDPAQAIGIAKALRTEANATVDEKLKRSQLMAAAMQLRNGVLGVNGAWSEQFVEVGPELYNLYAITLANLELRYHAAIVAEEGLRAIAPRIGKDAAANPWKKAGAWTAPGRQVQSLLKNAQNFANGLASRAKGSGVGALQSDVIELGKKISPDEMGQSADETLVVNELSDGNWEAAIAKARDFLKKYPTAQPKAYSWIVIAYSNWYDEAKKAKDEAKAKKIADELTQAAGAMESEAKAELAKNPAPERAKDWMRVLSTVQTAKLSVLSADGKFTEVLTVFGTDFWKNPPADEALRARVLRGLTNAVGSAETARAKDEQARGDAKSLTDAWGLYAATYATFTKFLPSIKDPVEREKTQRFGKNMVNAFNSVAGLADQLAKQPGAPAGLPDIARQARRAMADLLEPTITEKDKPGTILFCAETLWGLDEHARAVRLYELFQRVIDADAELTAFSTDPKPVLDGVDAAIGKRPEVAGDWAKVRDLVEDKPGLADLIKQGEAPDKLGEKPANFEDARAALGAFRGKAEQLKTKLGAEGWTAADTAMKQLDKLLTASVQKLTIKARLAQGYRESGNAAKAQELYSELYNYDPANPTYAAAYVDIVIDSIKKGTPAVEKAAIEKARDIARSIRNDAGKNLDLYWQADIQVMELSLALGDSKEVNDRLNFNAVNRSRPSDDLIQPPVRADDKQVGDDNRVRRARNALAVELVNRYLAIFAGNGVTAKPTFRVDQVAGADGTGTTIFVPSDAPKFEVQTVPNQDDVDVAVIVEVGQSAIKPATK